MGNLFVGTQTNECKFDSWLSKLQKVPVIDAETLDGQKVSKSGWVLYKITTTLTPV